MKAKILVISDQFTHGGLETHIIGQARVLSKHGIELYLATGSANIDCPDDVFAGMLTGLPIGAKMTYEELLSTLEQIDEFISSQRITHIHAHPFYSIIVGLLAAYRSKLPFVMTIHGPYALNGVFDYGDLFYFLLKNVCFPVASRVFCVSKEVELLCRSLGKCETELLPNAVEIPEVNFSSKIVNAWMWAGRIDELKYHGLIDLIEKVDVLFVNELHIYGDGPKVQEVKKFLFEHPDKAEFVKLMGWNYNLPNLMTMYAGIAGMGRVILEGAALNKPCLLVGYDGVKGMLDVKKFEQASFWNFSGRGLPTISSEKLKHEYNNYLQDKSSYLLREWIVANRDEKVVWLRYVNQIKNLAPVDSPLVRAVLDAIQYRGYNSQAIWWDKELIRFILGLLMNSTFVQGKEKIIDDIKQKISLQNWTTLDVTKEIEEIKQKMSLHDPLEVTKKMEKEIQEIKQELSEITTILAEVTEEVNEIKQKLDDDIKSLETELQERELRIELLNNQIQSIRESVSWKITRPIRVMKNLLYAPERTTYFLLKTIYQHLPKKLQVYLNRPKHAFIRYYTSRMKNILPSDQYQDNDLSWEEFQQLVLSNRASYKGIFITEFTIDWNVPLFQRPQHIASAFAKLGYLSIYKTMNLSHDKVNGFRKISENLWITNDNRVDTIPGAIRSFYSTSYAHTKKDYEGRRKHGLVVYEYIDHIDPAISGDEENIRRLKELKNYAFYGGVDYIVTSAKALYEEVIKVVDPKKVLLVPNGVDIEHYRDSNHKRFVVPESFLNFKQSFRAIIGYFGAIAPWLWYEEIEKLVNLRSDLGFVFIGPDYYGGSAKLPKTKNVLWLGPVDYKILPGYAQYFDVCIIPFRPGEIARTTSPLKLFEYFALEKPVVVTSDMLECIQFPEVLSGNCAEELSNCIDQALTLSKNESFKKKLARLADENSWLERAKVYETIFETDDYKNMLKKIGL